MRWPERLATAAEKGRLLIIALSLTFPSLETRSCAILARFKGILTWGLIARCWGSVVPGHNFEWLGNLKTVNLFGANPEGDSPYHG
jgi:hypothetical protein